MPISTTGAAADVTGTFTNSVSTANGDGSGTIAIFTTPNTANAIFIVNYTVVANNANNLTYANLSLPGGIDIPIRLQTLPNSMSSGLELSDAGTRTTGSGTIKVGPNTALAIPVVARNGASALAGTFSFRIRYDYVGVVIS